jgi:hypothetical protein
MPTLAIVAPAQRVTLFNIEEHLTALIDSTELVAAEQEQEFIAELEAALVKAKDKRDHVAGFIVQCEGQAAMAKGEIVRLRKRQAFFEAAVERMEGYVLHVLMSQVPDAKGKYPPMVGNTSSFKAQRNPPTVSISDEAAVPASCKTISITLPAVLWESLLDSLDMDFAAAVLDAVTKPGSVVVKELVRDQIEAAVPDWKKQLEGKPSVYCDTVPGAAIAAGSFRLVRS